MERINGAKIDLENLTASELYNLYTYVQIKLAEVQEDQQLVEDEILRRSKESSQPLEASSKGS